MSEPSMSTPYIVMPPPNSPVAVAREFIARHYHRHDAELLRRQGGSFYRYDGACWPEHPDEDLRSALYGLLEHAVYEKVDDKGKVTLEDWNPTRHKVDDVADAIRSVVHVVSASAPPCWLNGSGETMPAPHEVVSMGNGLLHLPSRELLPHTPSFWVHHSLPFSYDPTAPPPAAWLQFLKDLWPDDPGAISALQEAFGYLLSGDTRLQKMLLIVGPKRSGKGTIARVLAGVIGRHNMCGPTLSSLATNFGLSPLIGRPLAVVSDARLSHRSDSSIVVERLLSISGEDTLTVDRKYREPWSGQLPTRFVILTNEVPRLSDSSGALASRFVVLVTSRSFYGHENATLTDELLAEAPGIFAWALQGLDRLWSRGFFVQPDSATDTVEALADLASPMASFVRDCCEVGPTKSAEVDPLFGTWLTWCEGQGIRDPGTKEAFGRDLRAAVPGVRKVRPRKGDTRTMAYQGIGLRPRGSSGGNNSGGPL